VNGFLGAADVAQQVRFDNIAPDLVFFLLNTSAR
jgi:hypothetical protein